MGHTFHFLDVFAEYRYSGNQLAVILDAHDLATEEMQAIALETNFSETTFVLSAEPRAGSFQVRIFTPTQELPFAGHPTLGTAWLIREEILQRSTDTVTLSLGIGEIPVVFEDASQGASAGADTVGFLRAPEATMGAVVPRDEIAPAVGLDPEDIESRVPVQQVTAGLEFLLVPVRTAEALRRCRLRPEGIETLSRRGLPPLVYLFCSEPDSSQNDLASRFFFDANGIREDPATGSATGALGRYLMHNDYFPEKELSLRVEQGALAGRPSLLRLRTHPDEGVFVGGRVFPIAKGELLQ